MWGVIVRTVYVWHVTWFSNAAAHFWGYRNYETGENSRNNWFVSVLSNGEGWHNNHHASPRSATHGHHWWEIDMMYGTIALLRTVGLVSDIVPPSVPHRLRIAAGQSAAVLEPHNPNPLSFSSSFDIDSQDDAHCSVAA